MVSPNWNPGFAPGLHVVSGVALDIQLLVTRRR